MKLKLALHYNRMNPVDTKIEIIDMKKDKKFLSGFGVLAKLNGEKEPTWLTIEWFFPDKVNDLK